MNEKNGVRIWPSPPTGFGGEGVSLVHQETDSNLITLAKEIYVYAFFDSYEREDPRTADTPFIYDVRNDLQPRLFDERTELLSARFDCVLVDYFDSYLPAFREFYQTERNEDIEAEEQDLEEDYWHGEELTERHSAILSQFVEDQTSFRILYLVAKRDDVAEEFVEQFFLPGRWIGFGLTPVQNQPPFVTLYGHDDDELTDPERFRLTSIWALTRERINSLRHVFSLDFAADAVLPEGPDDDEEEEIEVVVSIPMSSGRFGRYVSFSQQYGINKPRFPDLMKTGFRIKSQSPLQHRASVLYMRQIEVF